MTRLPKNGELPRLKRINPSSSAKTWVGLESMESGDLIAVWGSNASGAVQMRMLPRDLSAVQGQKKRVSL